MGKLISKERFYILLALIFTFLTCLVSINYISVFPINVVIYGTIVIFLMNVVNPIVDLYYKYIKKDKSIDVKSISFTISIVISLIGAIIFYYIPQKNNILQIFINKNLVWSINTIILLLNLAIIESKNNRTRNSINNKKRKEELKERIIELEELNYYREKYPNDYYKQSNGGIDIGRKKTT